MSPSDEVVLELLRLHAEGSALEISVSQLKEMSGMTTDQLVVSLGRLLKAGKLSKYDFIVRVSLKPRARARTR